MVKSRYNVFDFTHLVCVRLSDDQYKQAMIIIKSNKGVYNNLSHYVRCAITEKNRRGLSANVKKVFKHKKQVFGTKE